MFPELGHFGAPIAPGQFPEAGDGAPDAVSYHPAYRPEVGFLYL
jgi:hypothetical protein